MAHGRSGGSEDNERPGRIPTSKTEEHVEKTSELVRKDRSLGIRMIVEIANMDKVTVRQILHDRLNMRKVCAKMVPPPKKNSLWKTKTTGKAFPLTSWNEPHNNWMCLKMSSHVMKRRFFITIQKQRGN
jgi:hypothetical protein